MTSRSRAAAVVSALAIALSLLTSLEASAAGKTVHITKSESDGDAVPGATFTLFRDDPPVGGGPPKGAEDTVAIGTCTTAANGQCDITNVPPGNYWVSETGPPAGYTAAADSTLEVKRKNRDVLVFNDKTPTSVSVNDPAGDSAVDDGTHIFQFGPSVGVSLNGQQVGIAFNDSTGFNTPGGVSGTGWAFSNDGGETFTDMGKIPPMPGSHFIIGQPTTAFDPIGQTFVVANSSFLVEAGQVRAPIVVSIFDPATNQWTAPVNTFPGIPPDPAQAHDPLIFGIEHALRPEFVMGFTLSHGAGQSEGMFTRSTDGGQTWSPPVSVTGIGTFDFFSPVVARNGRIYTTWSDFGGTGATTNDILISHSDDNGATWSPPTPVATDVPKSGVPSACGTRTANTYLGEILAQDAPRTVVNPFDARDLFVTFTRAGQAGDESDVVLAASRNGGGTWKLRIIDASPGPQFFHSLTVTPDGRIDIAYYDARSSTEIEYVAQYFNPFTPSDVPTPITGAPMPLSNSPFPLWNLQDPYDTNYSPCFGLQGGSNAAPGSGFYFAWTDGSDPGPAGNNGVDPNIDFARFDGAFLVTTTSLSIDKTATELNMTGAVSPQPIPGARVTVTLFVNDERVARKRPTTGAGGRFATAFPRPEGRTCRIEARFPGSEGRGPSSTTKTFAC